MARRLKPQRLVARTRDGWKLALYRYATPYRSSRFGPVVLVHGLGANRYNLDAPHDEISLARYLRGRGHDVWVVELRGAGRSRPSRRRAPAWRPVYDFDDYVHKDVPAFVRTILDTSGYDHLHWVGHSMGGMLAYAALIHFDQRLFRSVVTLGSPCFSTGARHPVVDKAYRLRHLLKVLRWVPYRRFGYAAALFPKLSARAVGLVAANPDNLDPRHIRSLGPRVLHDLPAPLMQQFAEWYGNTGGFARRDGLLPYWEHLSRIVAPLLVIAGSADGLTPVADLRRVFDEAGSEKKKFLVCARENGFVRDYGHIDLVLGRDARREVYPHISEWIERHA